MAGRAIKDDSDSDESDSDSEPAQAMPTLVFAKVLLFVISSGMLFGIDLGSIGAARKPMSVELEMTEFQGESVVSGAKFGAIFGCLAGGSLIQASGRKTTVQVSSVFFLIGPLLLGSAVSFWMAAIGRILMGLGVGFASVAMPCYLSEVATAGNRGALVATYELAIALGFLFTCVVNYAITAVAESTITQTPESPESQEFGDCLWFACWRWEAGFIPMLAALPLVVATLLLPESPRWLLTQAGGDVKCLRNALVAMQRLGRSDAADRLDLIAEVERQGGLDEGGLKAPWESSDDELVLLWDEQHKQAGLPLLLSTEREASRPKHVKSAAERRSAVSILVGTLQDIFLIVIRSTAVPPGTSWGLLLAVLAAVLDQVCASTSILIYTQHLLEHVGIGSPAMRDQLSIAVAGAKVTGVVVGIMIVDKMGRRPLLGGGGILSAAFMFLVAVGAAYTNVALLLIGICGFIFVFVATWGNGYWVIVTEVTAAGGPRFTAASQAAASAMLFTAGWLTSLTFQSVIHAGGPWSITIYAALAAIMALYAFALLPETRGCTLEECAEKVRTA